MDQRRIEKYILEDLERSKMVFISGPRQTGKTTLAKNLSIKDQNTAYYNWDIFTHQIKLKKYDLETDKKLWIFDEIHKYKKWRNWLKGVYDLHKDAHRIIVTGSAKLDLYARGGDSLQGRYFNYRLHPFTLSEIMQQPELDYRTTFSDRQLPYVHEDTFKVLKEMLSFGGFPEPFLSKSATYSGRWRLAYTQRLIKEEVRSLELTQDLDQMQLLYERIPDLVSNNLSVNNLAKDLEVAHQTVSKWIAIFEKLYACFYILPFKEPRIRAVKKEKKLYLWDWARIEDPGARLENLVAVHLLRLVHWFEDVYGELLELRYFKDVDNHEIDFLVLRKKQPWLAIEVKSSEQDLSTGFKYFLKKVSVPLAFQIHLKSSSDIRHPNINKSQVRTMPVSKFLMCLP